MDLQEMQTGFSDKMASVGDTLKGSLTFLNDIKDAGVEKITASLNNILGLGLLIEMTGFNMKDISMDIGIPPGISLSFTKEKDVDPAEIEKIVDENKDKEMFVLIVRALLKADAMQKAMKLSNYKFGGLNMKIGLPPDVSLKFSKA